MLPNLLQKPSATKTSTVIVSGAQIHTINLFYGSYFNRRHGAYLFQQGESKTVLDSGFHAVDIRIQGTGFWILCQWISDSGFQSFQIFELHCGFPHMRRYEGIEKKLLSSVKERKCILRKQKEKIVLLLALIVRSTLLFSQFSQRILWAFYSTI